MRWLSVFFSLACVTAGCKPGELDESREKDFQKQLKKYYGPPATAAAPATTAPGSPSASASPSHSATPPPSAASSVPGPDAEVPVADAGAPMPDAEAPAALQFSQCALDIFAASCSGSACHYGGLLQLAPNLDRPDLAQLLSAESGNCADAPTPLFVDVEDPLSSYLWLKVQGQQPVLCGDAMPPTGFPALDETQMQCLEDWFASLAVSP